MRAGDFARWTHVLIYPQLKRIPERLAAEADRNARNSDPDLFEMTAMSGSTTLILLTSFHVTEIGLVSWLSAAFDMLTDALPLYLLLVAACTVRRKRRAYSLFVATNVPESDLQ